MKVYCIIVTYNGMRWIENCISSIKEDKVDLEILVVDNNSTDQTVQIIKDEFPFVRLIEKKENLGFGGANNLGYEIAKKDNAEFIYLLNQDTISYPNTIFKLIQGANINENTGVISPLHLNDDGQRLDLQFEKEISANNSPLLISDFLLRKNKQYYRIGFVNAAAWLISVNTIEKMGGLFSSAFFHYGEDNNFVSRLKYFGFNIYIDTDSFVHHCREERKGKKSIDFINKELFIKSQIKLYNINETFSSAFVGIIKYSINQLLEGNIKFSFKLLWNPIYNYKRIKKIKESYTTEKII